MNCAWKQPSIPEGKRSSTAAGVLDELGERYVLSPHTRNDPVDELVQTILSQNTSDINTSRAFRSLKAAFPDWLAVVDSPSQQVIDAIQVGGLANTKGPRIQNVLRLILEQRGSFDLQFLVDMPVADATTWLVSLPGVGPKTAACVLLFSLDRPVLPVDTHVLRVSKRLGLIPADSDARTAQRLLECQVSESDRYSFHMLVIQHGRGVCKARSPLCEECVLEPNCPTSTLARGQR